MYIEDILKINNFNNLSRDELMQICRILQNETKLLKNINNQKIHKHFYELNKTKQELNNLTLKYNKLNEQYKRLYKKLNVPLNYKERLSGKLNIAKINAPEE